MQMKSKEFHAEWTGRINVRTTCSCECTAFLSYIHELHHVNSDEKEETLYARDGCGFLTKKSELPCITSISEPYFPQDGREQLDTKYLFCLILSLEEDVSAVLHAVAELIVNSYVPGKMVG